MKQKQIIFIDACNTTVRVEFPPAAEELLPGVRWGNACGFSTPAYWKYHVLERRLTANRIEHRLGRNLAEEIGACLLGGHGIPASVGLAAYYYLRDHGIFETAPSESQIKSLLEAGIPHDGKIIRYRFTNQKSKYLAGSLSKYHDEYSSDLTGRKLRDWLSTMPGIGLKTASWITRNFEDSDDVAILDIHLLRAGIIGKFFSPNLDVTKNYLDLENRFLEFSASLSVKPSELDSVIWFGMMSSPSSVDRALSRVDMKSGEAIKLTRPRAHPRKTNSRQLAMAV
ncbi:hypothetical protein QEH59_12455 [Coraliomargarita sp. SDUM461004]|uniref:8-oxoguanine DNA glycosylase n=1 Tax=Thalassobacterium sedimentorum TaxID=3041258 RepID=A0ABU1AKA1_9BACT|nr:hypothetical protein [Coraliomargarita sp. SDUM461004]MDQ8195242.1 hypothetical protein [Coraliomargarita sp. SDUM461004]